jgi:hypothetical protein
LRDARLEDGRFGDFFSPYLYWTKKKNKKKVQMLTDDANLNTLEYLFNTAALRITV